MDRKTFLKAISIFSVGSTIGKLEDLSLMRDFLENTERMPVLFLGHGSPMNAIEENEFVHGFRSIGNSIPTPQAIICISAHWETYGTKVTANKMPKTIHDFGGFPQKLFDVRYPAPGNPELATILANRDHQIALDESWGLDHGAWSVIKHLYPNADIPVIQLSLDRNKSPKEHVELAKTLSFLRRKGVLIIGSGNLIHNLRLVAWNRMQEDNYGFDWAKEVREKMNNWIIHQKMDLLIDYSSHGNAFRLAIPTPEHYLPLLYVMALHENGENIELFNDKYLAGSLSMTSVKIS